MTADPSPKQSPSPVDVLILTYNEEANLPNALRSVTGWVNRVFVVDSGSSDQTEQLARDAGAEFVHHSWEGYARQKNWALDNLPLEAPWVLILDGDEGLTPALRAEVAEICSRPSAEVLESGFYINRYLVFMGSRIRHCGYFPSWNLRLFKRGSARYEDRPVHEHMVLNGQAGYLKGLLWHEDRRGLEYYIAKHNRYSTLEAETIFFGPSETPGVQPRLFGDAVERRRFFKTVIYPRLPARWLGRFIWMYIIRLGFLDGRAGLRFCLLISSHELYTTLKLRELQQQAKAARQRTSAVQLIDDLPRAANVRRGIKDSQAIAPAMEPRADGRFEYDRGDWKSQVHQSRPGMREASPWSFSEKVRRATWMVIRATLFRCSFHNWYGWRRALLRSFGARIGKDVRIRPTAVVEIPWNLRIGNGSVIGDHAILYSLGIITLGQDVVVSQYAHLCAGTHDYTLPEFPLLRPPITIGDQSWIAADAFVGPGVTIGPRSVIGARSTVVKDVPPNVVVGGNPARILRAQESRS